MFSDTLVTLHHAQTGATDERWEISPAVITFERWYGLVEVIKTETELTEGLQKRLNEVKNLLVYSRHVYSFASTAFIMALLLLEAYLRETGILSKGQTLGNFVNNHQSNGTLPATLTDEMRRMVNLRNHLIHESAMLHPPHVMLKPVQDCLRIMDSLTAHYSAQGKR